MPITGTQPNADRLVATTRWGRQPARALLTERGLNPKRVAVDLGLDRWSLYNAVNGRVRPTADVRRVLAEYLGVPEAELFTAEARVERSEPEVQR